MNENALEYNFKHMLILMGVVGVFLLGLVLLWDAEERAKQNRLHEYRDISVTNGTPEQISVWTGRGTDATADRSEVNELIRRGCGPPQCGITSGATWSWEVDLKTDSDYPPFLVVAWTSETGEIVYAAEHEIGTMNQSGWNIRVTDQR